MGDGGWEMGDGGWEMGDGGWEMGHGSVLEFSEGAKSSHFSPFFSARWIHYRNGLRLLDALVSTLQGGVGDIVKQLGQRGRPE